MFFRIHKFIQNGREYKYLRLVENYRANGSTKQRIIANFGNISSLKNDEIKYLVNDLSKISSSKFKSLKKTRSVNGNKYVNNKNNIIKNLKAVIK